jgi:asparagine synthase (glutamine-hydrolysing)
MCGICGFTGKKDIFQLKKMADAIVHRGPDDEGYYSDANINLGVRRLSIIDVETGHQPVYNEDKNIWAVFNGEIYNFKDLRKELKQKGHKFYTDHSDTEVIVHLYEEYGTSFMHKLNGMFAIAIWDKNKQELLLIRDRMGVKPLFYAAINNGLIFGSEIKSILAHSLYSKDINYEAVYHYFTFKNIPAPLTAFKGIYSLLPGEMLSFSNGKISKNKWWKLKFAEKNDYEEIYLRENILKLLADATKLRMVSDVPIGAYLSGGVDSSSVVALMAKFSKKPVKTFSLGYEDELKNKEADLLWARKVSQRCKTEHYEYIMSHKELIEDIEKIIVAFDQPFSGTISTFFLTKLIKQHVKVALTGDGADELFGSYLSHRVALPMHHFVKLYDKVKSSNLTEEEERLFAPADINFLEELFKKSKGQESSWRHSLYLFSDEEKNTLLSTGFKNKVSGLNSFGLVQKNFENLTAKDPLNRILEMEWNTQLPDQVLAFADSLSMAHSVEIRSPFLDWRLVEFVATIPGDMKIKNGIVKDIFKNAVKDLLPQGITERPKEGFVLPIFDWMIDRLKIYSKEVLSEKRINKHNLLDSLKVNDILQDYYAGNKANAAKAWNLMCFQLWWEKYFG